MLKTHEFLDLLMISTKFCDEGMAFSHKCENQEKIIHLTPFFGNIFSKTGFYLLVTIYRKGTNHTPQQLFLINLTLCEIIINFFEILRRVDDIYITASPHSQRITHLIYRINEYELIVRYP